MKHFKRHYLAFIPLLSILAMSPSALESQFVNRQIASVVEEVAGHPKYEALVSKVDEKAMMKDLDLNAEKFKVKRDELKSKISKEREEFKKEQSDSVIVSEQRNKIESLVVSVLLLEGGLKDLQYKQEIEQADDEASLKVIAESKDLVEGLLSDLEANEALVAKASEPKTEETAKEEKPVVAEEGSKEEVKPVVVVEEEPKKEEKSEQEKLICDLQDKNEALSKQMEQLLSDQNKIMQTILGMAQMMVSMHQNQGQGQGQNSMPNPYYANGNGFQTPYQYQQPLTAGNWVYYPQGFQPSQPNIFSQPQIQDKGGIYPDQMHQRQSNWNLQPQNYFEDPRYNSRPYSPGQFGNDAFSYNLGNNGPSFIQG